MVCVSSNSPASTAKLIYHGAASPSGAALSCFMSTPLPKLSYVLLSHNREKYIRAAIESAFAQDYEGELEYIFSDDCSTDRTFEIIKECVAEYKGNRRVVVTQTPKNLHLAGNTNHALQFVESDWIVRADDDDYSAVDRCSLIGRAIAPHPDARYVTTGVIHFSDEEEPAIRSRAYAARIEQPEVIETSISVHSPQETAFRSNHLSYKAWHMDVFREFGPLHLQGYYVDDLTCFYRASILGTGVHIPNCIAVFMRDGSGNMSRGGDDNQRGFHSIMRLERFNDKYYNITHAPMCELQAALLSYIRERKIQHTESFMLAMEQEMQKRALLCTFWRKGILNRIRISRILGYRGPFAMIRCLPMPIFAVLLHLFRFTFRKG